MALSCNPADIVKAAACFKCIPPTTAPLVKAYLLCQTAKIADPTNPCSTPSAPTALQVLNTSNTTIKVGWKQTKNTGSFITGYKVFWGTTSGGPYTSNSGVIPTLPRNYTITGLSVGTTYFIVVVALSAVPGCQSANSSEVSGTTTGAAPNGLLNGLVHYYDMTTFNASQTVDIVGGDVMGALNGGADMSLQPNGIIGNCVNCSGAGTLNALILFSPINPNYVCTDANHSQTYQCWFWADNPQVSAFAMPFSIWGGGNAQHYIYLQLNRATNQIDFAMATDGVGGLSHLTIPAITLQTWHHFVGGYDGVNHVQWYQLDNGPRVTTPMATINGQSNAGNWYIFDANTIAQEWTGRCDEIGVWHDRLLSTTDVANLYNGGNGLAFNKFTT